MRRVNVDKILLDFSGAKKCEFINVLRKFNTQRTISNYSQYHTFRTVGN